MARRKNAINPATGKRFRSADNDGSWEYNPERNEYYVPGSAYDPRTADPGEFNGNASSGADAGNDRNQETERVLFETEGVDRIIVEKGTAPPKETKRSTRGPGKKTGAITAAHVNSWVTMGMATVAMYRNSKIWLVQDARVELDPWTPSAAELLNKIPQEYAEKMTDLSAVTVVGMGVFNMVSVRLAQEQRERMERAKERAAVMQAEEFTEYQPAPQPTTYVPNGHVSSNAASGARPVTPEESIFGNGI